MSDTHRSFAGFSWGPITITPHAVIDRGRGTYRVLRLTSGPVELHIYISPTGRSVRIFRDGRELR